MNLCSGCPQTPNSLILEFFSNFVDVDSTTISFRVYLRGLWYNISLDVVAAASRIPRVSNPTFPFDCNSAPNCGIMLSCFCDPPMEWGPHVFVGTNHFSAESRLVI